MWSVGCVMYTMLLGEPPFQSDNEQELLKLVSSGKINFNDDKFLELSEDAVDLLKKIFCLIPNRRITPKQAL
jgi:calcium/calmodulin-dependent protein kinase I